MISAGANNLTCLAQALPARLLLQQCRLSILQQLLLHNQQ
jgi:hypothetical protein